MLYEKYRQAGQLIEKAIGERGNGGAPKDRSQLVKLLEGLNLRNYNFAEAGLSAILSGRFGGDLTPAQRASAVTPLALTLERKFQTTDCEDRIALGLMEALAIRFRPVRCRPAG